MPSCRPAPTCNDSKPRDDSLLPPSSPNYDVRAQICTQVQAEDYGETTFIMLKTLSVFSEIVGPPHLRGFSREQS